MRILHLSDTHITAAPGPNRDGIDPRDSLRRMLDDCARLTALDAVVVSGDVADDGSAEAYADARDLVSAFAHARGIPAIFSTGNHDARAPFAALLGTGHLSPPPRADSAARSRLAARPDLAGGSGLTDRPGSAGRPDSISGVDPLDSPDGELAAVTVVAGYRIITLDSLVPGKAYGEISVAQLDWLRGVLAEPAPIGSVLVFHHPPVVVPGVVVQRAFGLLNGPGLADAIRGSDVRLMLCGHFHLQLFGMFEGVPVWVTPGVVNRIDLTAAPGTERAAKGASASLIDLGGPHSPVCHTLHSRDPHAGETAHDLDTAALAAVIAELGPQT